MSQPDDSGKGKQKDSDDDIQDAPSDEEEIADGDDNGEEGFAAGGLDSMAMGDDEDDEDLEDDAVHVFKGHHDAVYAVACNPGSLGQIATGGGDDFGYLWRIGDEHEPIQLKAHTDSISAIEFSADGALVATGGLDGAVCVWDSVSGGLVQKLEGPGDAVEWVSWHPRGRVLLAGSEDFTAWMWNVDTGNCMQVLSGHSGSVTCGAFTPDGKSIITGSSDSSLRIWSPKTGVATSIVQGHPFHTEGLTSLAVSADSALAVTGSTDTSARLVNLQTGKVLGCLEGHENSVECVGLCSGLPLAATGSLDSALLIWDLNSLQVRTTCPHEDGVVKLLWHPVAPLIFSGSLDGGVRLWDARTGNCERTWRGHQDHILDMAITSDGSFVVSGSDDGSARVFGMN